MVYTAIVPIEIGGWKGEQLYVQKGNLMSKKRLLEHIKDWSSSKIKNTWGKSNWIKYAELQEFEGIHIYNKNGVIVKTIKFRKGNFRSKKKSSSSFKSIGSGLSQFDTGRIFK